MAASSSSSLRGSILTFNGFRPCDASSSRSYCLLSLSSFSDNNATKVNRCRLKQKKPKDGGNVCRAMVQQTVQGPSAAYARDMERLSAKESLLLAVSSLIFFYSSIAYYSITLVYRTCWFVEVLAQLGIIFDYMPWLQNIWVEELLSTGFWIKDLRPEGVLYFRDYVISWIYWIISERWKY